MALSPADAAHVLRRDNERLALNLRHKLCEECYLDVKLCGRRLVPGCRNCKDKTARRGS